MSTYDRPTWLLSHPSPPSRARFLAAGCDPFQSKTNFDICAKGSESFPSIRQHLGIRDALRDQIGVISFDRASTTRFNYPEVDLSARAGIQPFTTSSGLDPYRPVLAKRHWCAALEHDHSPEKVEAFLGGVCGVLSSPEAARKTLVWIDPPTILWKPKDGVRLMEHFLQFCRRNRVSVVLWFENPINAVGQPFWESARTHAAFDGFLNYKPLLS